MSDEPSTSLAIGDHVCVGPIDVQLQVADRSDGRWFRPSELTAEGSGDRSFHGDVWSELLHVGLLALRRDGGTGG